MKLEIFKCAALTVIALLLAVLTWTVRTKDINVFVSGGSVEIEGTPEVDVKNTVDIDGTVRIER